MIYVRKDGKESVVGFAQVPYRWYVNHEFNALYCYYDLRNPFDVEEVINKLRMKPIDERFEFYKKEVA